MRVVRGYIDWFLFLTNCLSIFHRETRQDLGYAHRDSERMVCTRCGSVLGWPT